MYSNLVPMNDVTVIIPVYNEVCFIEDAIKSAIHQAEFVIVSDNNSTDGTAELCRKLSKHYSNLVLIEQSSNIGAVKNSEIIYNLVSTEYVMTMGGHDLLEDNYVCELKKSLEETSNAVMAFSPVNQIDDQGNIFGEYLVEDLVNGISSEDPFVRTFTLIKDLTDCSIVFGLFRSSILLKNIEFVPTAGIDHVWLCSLAEKGKFVRVESTRFYRRFTNRENSDKAYMERIAGASYSSDTLDYGYMCKAQMNIVKSIRTINYIKKLYYILATKRILNKRFRCK